MGKAKKKLKEIKHIIEEYEKSVDKFPLLPIIRPEESFDYIRAVVKKGKKK